MEKLLVLIFSIFICCDNSEGILETPQSATPIIKIDSTFDVIFTENIIYGQGLSHENINSENAISIPLFMDSYVPDNLSQNRPVLMLIHGGGFVGGSKQQQAIVNIANYFAERGWVVFSIDYRLMNDFGTVPQAWIDFAPNINPSSLGKFFAVYPAHRDAKAALRWIVANKSVYNINTNYITVGGGSAGAVTSIGISVSNQEDYKNEISLTEDNSLSSTNLDQSYQVHTILDFWGSKTSVQVLELIYGFQRFDSNDPPLYIVHGTEDLTVLFSEAEELRDIYENNQVPYIFYELPGAGHGPWNATVEGVRLEKLAFDFVVEQQQLILE
tara:strand:- start:44 stop:1027 length:984 start_codon:yes stop_codon:yes gene_type:complete